MKKLLLLFFLNVAYAGGIYSVKDVDGIRTLTKISQENMEAIFSFGSSGNLYDLHIHLEDEIELEKGVTFLAFGSLEKHFLLKVTSKKLPRRFLISALSRNQAKILQVELPSKKGKGITFIEGDVEKLEKSNAK